MQVQRKKRQTFSSEIKKKLKTPLDGTFNVDELGLFSNPASSRTYISSEETWAHMWKVAENAPTGMLAVNDSGGTVFMWIVIALIRYLFTKFQRLWDACPSLLYEPCHLLHAWCVSFFRNMYIKLEPTHLYCDIVGWLKICGLKRLIEGAF